MFTFTERLYNTLNTAAANCDDTEDIQYFVSQNGGNVLVMYAERGNTVEMLENLFDEIGENLGNGHYIINEAEMYIRMEKY